MRQTVMTSILAGITIFMVGGLDVSAGDQTNNWTLVDGDQIGYRNAKEEEIVCQGTLTVENYGQPGVQYFRVPNNYWLKTKKEKLSLSIQDTIFPPLDGKSVEVKGKMRTDHPSGHKRLWVGWIRLVETKAEHHAGGYSVKPQAAPLKPSA